MFHVATAPVSSWPNGIGKGLFRQTVSCSCGESFTAEESNNYYDLELAATAQSQWKQHAYPFNRGVLQGELERLPVDVPVIRSFAEAKLKEWKWDD